MKSLRVTVAGTLPPTVGGIASVVDQHAVWLRAAGCELEVVNTGRSRRRRPGAASLENALAVVVDAARVARACRRNRSHLVAIHTVGSPSLPLVRALTLVAAARAWGVPVVSHLHGYDIEARVRHGTSTYRRLLRWLCRASARVVALHEGMRDAVLDAAPRARVVVVPNCIDLDPTRQARPMGRRVVFVGTVGERKGVPELLTALAALPEEVTCDLVGGHGEEDPLVHRSIIERARTLGLTDRVHFHGELDHDAALQVLRTASVFALPSSAEGMPMALLESLALGVPAVVSDAGAMGALVGDSGAGLVVPAGDPDRLADALRELLFDDSRLAACAAAARDFIDAHHRCDRVLPMLLDEYETVRRG